MVCPQQGNKCIFALGVAVALYFGGPDDHTSVWKVWRLGFSDLEFRFRV